MSASLKSISYAEDYGSGISMVGIYQCIVAKTTTADPVVAVAIAKADADIPAFGERAASTVDMYSTTRNAQLVTYSTSNLIWIVNITVDFKPGHLIGNK